MNRKAVKVAKTDNSYNLFRYLDDSGYFIEDWSGERFEDLTGNDVIFTSANQGAAVMNLLNEHDNLIAENDTRIETEIRNNEHMKHLDDRIEELEKDGQKREGEICQLIDILKEVNLLSGSMEHLEIVKKLQRKYS